MAALPTIDTGNLRQANDKRDARFGEFADISFARIKGWILILAFFAFLVDVVKTLHDVGVCSSESCRTQQIEVPLQKKRIENKTRFDDASCLVTHHRLVGHKGVLRMIIKEREPSSSDDVKTKDLDQDDTAVLEHSFFEARSRKRVCDKCELIKVIKGGAAQVSKRVWRGMRLSIGFVPNCLRFRCSGWRFEAISRPFGPCLTPI